MHGSKYFIIKKQIKLTNITFLYSLEMGTFIQISFLFIILYIYMRTADD
jgi:hypothetical protein